MEDGAVPEATEDPLRELADRNDPVLGWGVASRSCRLRRRAARATASLRTDAQPDRSGSLSARPLRPRILLSALAGGLVIVVALAIMLRAGESASVLSATTARESAEPTSNPPRASLEVPRPLWPASISGVAPTEAVDENRVLLNAAAVFDPYVEEARLAAAASPGSEGAELAVGGSSSTAITEPPPATSVPVTTPPPTTSPPPLPPTTIPPPPTTVPPTTVPPPPSVPVPTTVPVPPPETVPTIVAPVVVANPHGHTEPSDLGLARLRACESGPPSGNYSITNPTGAFRGAYQFTRSTWDGVATRWYPHLVGLDPINASAEQQDQMARALWSERGAQPWPTCGRCVTDPGGSKCKGPD